MYNPDNFGSEITQRIWKDLTCIILIYVGSAADFALNSSIDWLFFTNSLPSAPQERFIQTFAYNQKLFCVPKEEVKKITAHIRKVHTNVEMRRTNASGHVMEISPKAFIEVSDMLIDYGIRSYEYLYRTKLTLEEKQFYFQDLKEIVVLMGIDHPDRDYIDWESRRARSIKKDLQPNEYTPQLYQAYRNDIGGFRYFIITRFQTYFVSKAVQEKLQLKRNFLIKMLYILYPYIHSTKLAQSILKFGLKKETMKALNKMQFD